MFGQILDSSDVQNSSEELNCISHEILDGREKATNSKGQDLILDILENSEVESSSEEPDPVPVHILDSREVEKSSKERHLVPSACTNDRGSNTKSNR